MTAPVTVVGGGLAGGAAALLLARAGVPVRVFERSSGPEEKICGEFLSAEACAMLAALGLDLPGLGAQPIGAVRLVRGHCVATVPLPSPGFGLSRHVLDEAVLARAAAEGAELRRGEGVAALRAGADGRSVIALAKGAAMAAGTVFLATGKQELRGLHRRRTGRTDDLVGFKQHLALAPAARDGLGGHVELALFPGGYAGLQPVTPTLANLCLMLRRRRLTELGGSWEKVLSWIAETCPHLGTRLCGARATSGRPLAIARVPYGFLHADGPAGPGDVWRLGDQAAVIPSFAGSGMAIALHSAALAARMFGQGAGAAAYHGRLRAELAPPVRRAQALYRLGRWRAGQATLAWLAASFPGTLRQAIRLTRVAGP